MATKKNNYQNRSLKGFTILELLVGLVISIIASFACYEAVTKSTQNYLTISAASENIVETIHATVALKRKISLAVNLEGTIAPITSNLSLVKAQIIPFDLTGWVASSGDGKIVAVFSGFIDSLKSNYQAPVPTRNDRFLPMAIFFQLPTINKYGVIYLTIGTANSLKLLPEDASMVFDHIVDFKIKNIMTTDFANPINPASPRKRVSKFDLEVTRRSFNLNPNRFDFKWCPPGSMTLPVCSDTPAYTDSTEFATVQMRNNVLERNSQQQKIFKTMVTTGQPIYEGVPKRFIDGIYFLDSSIPSESLKR